MFAAAAARTLPVTRAAAGRRFFHASAPVFVKVGDKLPNVDLVEGSPGNKVNLASELTGKGLVIGTCRVNGTCSLVGPSSDYIYLVQVSRPLSRPHVLRTTFLDMSTRPS
jgi:hypothetical protein